MWTVNNDGTGWSESAKILLVTQIDQNRADFFNERGRRSTAWTKVHKSLIDAGMPVQMSIEQIKTCWTSIQLTAKAHQAECCTENNRQETLNSLSKLNQLVINMLNEVDYDEQNIMPEPILEIKKEPEDEYEETSINSQSKRRLSKKTLNPVVKLSRIEVNDNDIVNNSPSAAAAASILAKKHSGSVEYWEMMKKIAENELKLKLSQRENEEERMENEREIHQKNLILLDFKIKVQQLQINALQGHNNFD